MPALRRRSLAFVLSAAFIAQPAMAMAVPGADPPAPDSPPAVSVVADAPGPAEEAPAAPHDDGRAQIAAGLIKIGYDPEPARGMASQLTPADLQVLLANPKMMQQAGTMSTQTTAFIIGGVIVAGIVVLAVAGDATVQIN